jgi:SAM-dependent methyltransferase
MALTSRRRAYGQDRPPTAVDRFGVWLSVRQVRRWLPPLAGLRVGDVGCGYHARFARAVLRDAGRLVLLDVALAPHLKDQSNVTAIEGHLPEAMAEVGDRSLDVVVCNSVLEHLWAPLTALREFHRVLAPAGTLLVNVPSWRGKHLLELSAFRFGTSPIEEIDDHKMYYDPRDLWPLLVRAGFPPRGIRCIRHKFGLNTFARCGKPSAAGVVE